MSTAPSLRRRSCTEAWPHLAELAAELQDDVLERFLRYVRIDTTSDSDSETYPSTAKQRDLGELLARELRELGLEDVEFTEHGYVFATVPGSTGPTIGLIAHMDTSADESGTDVQPQVIRNYDGGDIVLPGDPRKVLRAGENPLLAEHAGHDIVTTDGTTLLGADDKAGVAEIMGAVAYLVKHPEVEHAPVRVGFTVSKKIGTAVERNRVRRRLKEIVRLSAATGLSCGHDYVLIGRRAALSLPFEQISEDFKRALRRLRVPK